MTCHRCGGLFHLERVLSRHGQTLLHLLACFNCGFRLDERIHLNQAVAREQAMEAAMQRSWKAQLWAEVQQLANLRKVAR